MGPVDRRTIVDVMGPWEDDGPDRGEGQSLDFGGNTFDRAARLRVRVEEIATDEDEVDFFGEGEVDRRRKRRELPLPLGRGLFAEISVTGTEVDVRRMKEA